MENPWTFQESLDLGIRWPAQNRRDLIFFRMPSQAWHDLIFFSPGRPGPVRDLIYFWTESSEINQAWFILEFEIRNIVASKNKNIVALCPGQ